MNDQRVKTPCIGVCSTGIGDRVCRGCKRFAHEVIYWNSYDDEQKMLIEKRLEDFLSRCVRNKLQVTDGELLQRELDTRGIAYPEHRNSYCRAYCLLKAAASQIADPAEFGLMIDTDYRDLPLQELRLAIDEEFFILSDAYYERYLGASRLA
jgi:predicted Fe-S protein YdhL (DUF1289 family)